MLFELALFSVLLPCGYWGVVALRRRALGITTLGLMLLGTAVLAAVSLIGRRNGLPGADLFGAIAIGAGAIELVIAPIVRVASHWATRSYRLELARALVGVRGVLQPGPGAQADARGIDAIRKLRDGRAGELLAELEAARDRLPERARPAIDAEILGILLFESRHQDALDHAAQRLEGASLRPPLAVGLVNARIRVGDWDGAAIAAERIDRAWRDVAAAASERFRLHILWLASLGRVADVERQLARKHPLQLPAFQRAYWRGLAHAAAGDRAAATACLQDARARVGRDFRYALIVDRALARLDEPAPAPTEAAVRLADAFARAPIELPPRAPAPGRRVTYGLIVGNLAVAAVCAFALTGAGDIGALIRAGANVRTAVDAGEWWRVPASVFVHVGATHLIVNLLALWSMGRLVEGLFGGPRMLAIYGGAGLTGAVASHLWSSAGISAGASGAIFGLLGAAVIELAIHRKRYRPEWRRSLLQMLIIVTIAQLGMGFAWTQVDQWAHLGGLAGGVVLGALLSPGWPWSGRAVGRWLARGLAAATVLIYLWGEGMAATHDYGDRLAATARVTRTVGPAQLDAPADWTVDGPVMRDESLDLLLMIDYAGQRDLDEWARFASDVARDQKYDGVDPAPSALIAAPPGWEMREYQLSAHDELSSTHSRMVVWRAEIDGVELVGALYLPEQLLHDARRPLGEILATLRPAP